MFPVSWRLRGCSLLLLLVALFVIMSRTSAKDAWERPGCHKVGHTRKISIPDCVEFHITTNACRGYCESWAVPSAIDTLRVNPHQTITSVGQCCNIMDTEDVSNTVTSCEKKFPCQAGFPTH
ncbi:hypothetical protein Cfor_00721 [Coptotermes formosanus]|uniref:DAN domain-containing protein n=1 Tax=Coptotermes formosanus TaxID=36987 RepID=A0A6L2Q8P5_COPFO|nr:hypothetical protein Cfor_00721 [Coptotermes formosanus]